jgi:predicted ATPase
VITNLSLKNFKAFENETFELGRLNILAGLNNSGKSSVIQALRLINEGKPIVGLGPLQEYIRHESSELYIECIQKNNDCEKKILFSYDRNKKTISYNATLNSFISYISADRYGPRELLPLNIEGNTQTVGNYGENLIDFLELCEGRLAGFYVPEALVIGDGEGIRYNIQEWLRIISPGIDFNYERYVQANAGRTVFNGHRSVHAGFGLSYTLPIIASILVHSSQLLAGDIETALLLIENPEAHLHPSGQTMMGRMLALAASCGLQIVVETHSDHLLNGIRIAVKEEKLPCTDVKCYFFKSDDSSKPASVEQLTIDEHGMLDHWPDGFFDQTEKNLLRLV